MIDKETLDKVLPLPELDELKDEAIAELTEEGFAITNFHSGGIFYTLLMIVLRIKVELTALARSLLSNLMVSHATDIWLDLKVSDYSKKRKTAQKTQGYITVSRVAAQGDAIKIAKGHVFKTEKDINGEELRFFTLDAWVLQKDAASVNILVEAEVEGTKYNVSQGQITRSLTYLGEVTITNVKDWTTQEGSDEESDEALRSRTLLSWADLAQRPIADAYKNAAESVTGVLSARVNDQLPRGQGTIDVIVTGTAGEATEALLDEVRAAIDKIIGPCDDVLVMSSVAVYQSVDVTISIPTTSSAEDLTAAVRFALTEMMSISNSRVMYMLTKADIIHMVKGVSSEILNVAVNAPSEDVLLDKDKVILLEEISVSVERVSL